MDSSNPPPAMEPPSYEPAGTPNVPSPTDLLKPTTLYVAERFIHTADPQAPPAYEFSHSVNFLSNTDRKVTVERLDYSVRTVNGGPALSTRKRTLFDLTHRTPGEMPNFAFQAESKSRTTAGSMGIEQRREGFRRRLGYRVCRAAWGADRRLADAGTTLYTASAPSGGGGGDGAVSWEWSDEKEQLLAREVTNDMLASLVITAEMSQAQRDALVAAWIMRLWWDLADGKYHRLAEGSQDRMKRAFPSAGSLKVGMHNGFGSR